MTLKEFGEKIKAHETLELRDVIETETDQWLQIKETGKDGGWEITVPSITGNTWETLEPILLGLKEPTAMIQLTRIVGYYSRVNNWNASKLEELKARQAGNYAISEKE